MFRGTGGASSREGGKRSLREGTATAKERVRGGRRRKKSPATAAGMGNKLGRMEETRGGELERTGDKE